MRPHPHPPKHTHQIMERDRKDSFHTHGRACARSLSFTHLVLKRSLRSAVKSTGQTADENEWVTRVGVNACFQARH